MSWQANVDLVQKLYIAFYGRPADPGGLRYWAQSLGDNPTPDTIKSVINAFIRSDEAKHHFLGDPTDPNVLMDVIDKIYDQSFHRSATDAEKAAFTGKTVADVLFSIINVSSGSDYVSLSNKLEYANQFWKYIDPNQDGLPDDDSSGSKFMATFAGNVDADNIAAKLLFVDASHPATPNSVLNDVKLIADPGDAIINQLTTFNLTIGIDNLTGTSGDDVFVGDKSTVQMADSINGSGGNDTFKYYAYSGVMPQMKSIETLDLIAAAAGIDTTSYTDLKNIVVEQWNAGASRTIKYLSTQSLDFVNNNNSKTINLQPDTGSKIAVTLDSNAKLNLDAAKTAVDATKITELDLTAVGTNKGVTVGQSASNLATVKILGDGSIELTNTARKIVYDASGNKGGVTVDAGLGTGNIPAKFIGSSGVDTLKLGANYAPIFDNQLQNVENIVLTASSKTLNLSNQTEGFNITAKGGNNTITGGQGADTIKGGSGNDIIRGGAGADTITTGAGTDKVIFDDFRTADKITDFTTGTDKLYIDFQVANANAGNYIGLLASKVFVGMAGSFKSVRVLNTAGTMIVAKQILAASAMLTKLNTKVTGLTTGNPIKFGTKNIPIVSVANYTKLTAALNKLIATNSKNANALIFARTQASGKLYFGAIIDNATMTAGLGLGGKITIKTIATVTGNFTANDIYIM